MIRKIEFGSPEFDQEMDLRYRILRAPLNMVFHEKDIVQEFDSHHFGYFDHQNILTGCLVLKPLSDVCFKMRQVAVDSNLQGKGSGRALVEYSEDFVRRLGGHEIVLHARDNAIGFYEKLGYLKQGKPFKEVGLKHYKMSKQLS